MTLQAALPFLLLPNTHTLVRNLRFLGRVRHIVFVNPMLQQLHVYVCIRTYLHVYVNFVYAHIHTYTHMAHIDTDPHVPFQQFNVFDYVSRRHVLDAFVLVLHM